MASMSGGDTATAPTKPAGRRTLPSLIFDLGSDPGEDYNLFNTRMDMGWMIGIAMRAVAEYRKSIAKYPNIQPGEDFIGY